MSPNINDYYTNDANLLRLAATTPIITPVQCFNAGCIFSNVKTVVPPCNTAAPYTSGGTVYFITPPLHQQHARSSSAFQKQGCSSDRPLSARELAKLLMHSRKDHLPDWKLAQFDANPLNCHERFGQFTSTVNSTVLIDDMKLTYLKTLVTGKAKTAIANLSFSGVMYKDALFTLQQSSDNHKLLLMRILIS